MGESDDSLVRRIGAPTDAPVETLDVCSLGPPKPLSETFELLPEPDDEIVLVNE